ncbi:hypothetical protein J2756_001907 [Methanobacterium aggregans]|nr:hypothetical protein [Methanobacterium aggregans]MBP2046653.1 hypothetical protein [Methanobacterium aggregans]
MVGVSEAVTFIKETDGIKTDLIIPREFVKDFHFSTEEHLMIMLRVVGPDTSKVVDFFESSEEELFIINTTAGDGEKVSDEFLLVSMYMDEGPAITVDIDTEPAMVRVILDFKRVS